MGPPSSGLLVFTRFINISHNLTFFLYKQYGYPEKREVRQFQFTAWPDHGVPDHPTPLLMFMKRVKTSNPLDGGPMIVHCR
jgi:netrin-G3 ligand